MFIDINNEKKWKKDFYAHDTTFKTFLIVIFDTFTSLVGIRQIWWALVG